MKTITTQAKQKNFIIIGTGSGKQFIVQEHPDKEKKSDFYYLTSLNSDTPNRTESKSEIHGQNGYKIVTDCKLEINI